MSWSLHRFPINARAEDGLAAVGRALYMAAHFEDKGKYLLRVAGMAEAADADPVASLEDLIAGAAKDRRLVDTLRRLERRGPVSAADAARLHAARLARNFIAHEGARFSIHERPGGTLREAVAGMRTYDLGRLRIHLEALRTSVQDLSRGDNMVSTWCFDVEEGGKTDRPVELIDSYEASVECWVFNPVWDLLTDGD